MTHLSGRWDTYEIDAPIVADARDIEFGMQLVGEGSASIDKIPVVFANPQYPLDTGDVRAPNREIRGIEKRPSRSRRRCTVCGKWRVPWSERERGVHARQARRNTVGQRDRLCRENGGLRGAPWGQYRPGPCDDLLCGSRRPPPRIMHRGQWQPSVERSRSPDSGGSAHPMCRYGVLEQMNTQRAKELPRDRQERCEPQETERYREARGAAKSHRVCLSRQGSIDGITCYALTRRRRATKAVKPRPINAQVAGSGVAVSVRSSMANSRPALPVPKTTVSTGPGPKATN